MSRHAAMPAFGAGCVTVAEWVRAAAAGVLLTHNPSFIGFAIGNERFGDTCRDDACRDDAFRNMSLRTARHGIPDNGRRRTADVEVRRQS